MTIAVHLMPTIAIGCSNDEDARRTLVMSGVLDCSLISSRTVVYYEYRTLIEWVKLTSGTPRGTLATMRKRSWKETRTIMP